MKILVACLWLAFNTLANAAEPAKGELIARLPWGPGAAEIGGGPNAASGDAAPEAVPGSFLVDEAGALHLLDTVNRRILILKPGAPPAAVSLAALGDQSLCEDFARTPNGWLIADRTSNQVIQISQAGAATTRWTGFQRLGRVESAAGKSAARDDLALTVSRLAEGGKLEEVSKSPYAEPLPEGCALARPVLARLAVFAQGDRGFALDPHVAGDEVQDVDVAGADAKGRVILAISEGKGDERRGVWLTRVTPEGDVDAEVLAPPVDERYSSVPRFFRATPDGNVLTFRTNANQYEIWKFTLAAPAAARKATPLGKAADADARASAALCSGGDPRPALEQAAIAAAFDEAASRRVEIALAALDAGAPAADLCALAQAREALAAGDATRAKAALARADHASILDQKLWLEGQVLEKDGDLREALRRFQRIVLDHADSAHYPEAQAAVQRIIDSGKLSGAQAK